MGGAPDREQSGRSGAEPPRRERRQRRRSGRPEPRTPLALLGSGGLIWLLMSGCPQLIEDRFRTLSSEDGGLAGGGGVSVGGGGTASGGAAGSQGGSGGTGGTSSGASGGGAANGGAGGSASGGSGGSALGGSGGDSSGGSTASGGGGGDAGAGGTAGCGANGFSEPVLVDFPGLAGDHWGPSLSDDGLTLLFARESLGADDGELYRATRPSLDEPFGAPALVAELAHAAHDGTPHLSKDGTELFFFSKRGGDTARLWRATAETPGGVFAAPEQLAELNDDGDDFAPWLSDDARTLYFSSYRGGIGESNLWRAQRGGPGEPFAAPTQLYELNVAAREDGLTLADGGRTALLVSNRPGSRDLDIWYTSRYGPEDGFYPPVNATVLNSDARESDVRFSRDGREVFFSSNRGGSSGQRIWRAERTCVP